MNQGLQSFEKLILLVIVLQSDGVQKEHALDIIILEIAAFGFFENKNSFPATNYLPKKFSIVRR